MSISLAQSCKTNGFSQSPTLIKQGTLFGQSSLLCFPLRELTLKTKGSILYVSFYPSMFSISYFIAKIVRHYDAYWRSSLFFSLKLKFHENKLICHYDMAIFIHFTTTLWTAAHYRIPFINHRLLTFWTLNPM